MKINEISANNRVEIEYYNEDPFKKTIKGIVLSVEHNDIIFITELGEQIVLSKDKILAVQKNNFEKNISDNLTAVKNYYLEIYELEKKIESLKKQETEYKTKMYDAKFLSKFNTIGAVNMLNNYIAKEDRKFRLGDTKFIFYFSYNEKSEKCDSEILINIKAIKKFEFFNTEDKDELNRAMETYAPNKKDELEHKFPFIKDIFIKKRYVERESEDLFKAITLYEGTIEINEDNIIEIRTQLEKILRKINSLQICNK